MRSPRGSRLSFLILSFNYRICESIWDFTLPQILFLLKVKEEERRQIDQLTNEQSHSQAQPVQISFSPEKDNPAQLKAKAKSLEALFSQYGN